MKRLTLCVIFGGCSDEYEVSLRSAYEILKSLDYEKYEVIRVGITKKGEWLLFEGENEKILEDSWYKDKTIPVTFDLTSGNLLVLEKVVYAIHAHVFFPILHGGYGEDGRLQGLFDIMGVKYVGCNSFSGQICMDKALAKEIAEKEGIVVARWVELKKEILEERDVESSLEKLLKKKKISYPVFVKPTKGGSSVGVRYVKSRKDLINSIKEAFIHGDRVIIEEEIKGEEIEVALMQTKNETLVSSAGMIKYSGDFYDYETKYFSKDVEYVIPAKIPFDALDKVRKAARKLFDAYGCSSLARLDFFYTEKGKIVFNEINTMPGFTRISMFPKLFLEYGFSFSQIVENLISQALGQISDKF